jgi:parvulin-like peptidyl-prolyl isomerase
MRVRPTLCGLLMISSVCAGLGCSLFGKPKAAAPTMPAPVMPVIPKAARSQKAETPAKVGLPPVTLADGEVKVRAVAYVNNSPIFESELREAMLFRMREVAELQEPERSRKLSEIHDAELDKLIDRELCMDAATERLKKVPGKIMDELKREASKEYDKRVKDIKEQMKIKSDQEFQQFFEQQGLSLANFRRNVERSFISMEFMRNMIFPKIQNPPLSEIQEYYRANPAEFTIKGHLKWQDIFIDASKFPDKGSARRYADQVALQLRAGADFTTAAKELQKAGYNILPGEQGLGEQPGEIRPAELEPTLMRMSPNQVAGPLEFPGGYHIVKVTERADPGRKPLDADTQNQIRRKIQNLLAEKVYRRMVENLKTKAVIQKLE